VTFAVLRLLAWAAEGLEHEPLVQVPMRDARRLDQAYAYCDEIAREQGRTFYKASALLPDEKRRAVRALYAFCRITDDIIDRAGDDPAAALSTWKQRSLVAPPASDDPVVLAWADARARYHIPSAYAEQLIDGVARDLTTTRYASFDELAAYCYGVASPVGLLSMHIIGFAGREAIPYAVKLGVTLQLTNILRDVREDWAAGRIYLPQDELAAFGLSDDDIAAACVARAAVEPAGRAEAGVSDRWRAFMRFQVERNRQLYSEAGPGIAWLDPAGRLAIAAATGLYRDILEEIAARNGDVFTHRAKPRTGDRFIARCAAVVAVATAAGRCRRRCGDRRHPDYRSGRLRTKLIEAAMHPASPKSDKRFEVKASCAILHLGNR
jgi:phytoene synthase